MMRALHRSKRVFFFLRSPGRDPTEKNLQALELIGSRVKTIQKRDRYRGTRLRRDQRYWNSGESKHRENLFYEEDKWGSIYHRGD